MYNCNFMGNYWVTSREYHVMFFEKISHTFFIARDVLRETCAKIAQKCTAPK